MTYRKAIDDLLDLVTQKARIALQYGTENAIAAREHAEHCYKSMIAKMRHRNASPEDRMPVEMAGAGMNNEG